MKKSSYVGIVVLSVIIAIVLLVLIVVVAFFGLRDNTDFKNLISNLGSHLDKSASTQVTNESSTSNTVADKQNTAEKKESDKDTTVNVDEIYMNVLEDKTKFITEDNKETLFSKYIKTYLSEHGRSDVKLEYVLMDFDRDGENEMILLLTWYDADYLILNYEDGKIYGFQEVYRGLLGLKEDGSHCGSGGYNIHSYVRTTFNKNKKIEDVFAEEEGNVFRVNGSIVSKIVFDETLEREYLSKKDVTFKLYMEKYTPNK